MTVEILFKDKSTLTVGNIRKVTNASTNIKEDWIYIYGRGDINGKLSNRIKVSDIICVEVKE